MTRRADFRFNRFVLGLFAVALLTTSAVLFAISYVGSLSIADQELKRFAHKEATLARLVFDQTFSRLDTYLRALSENSALRRAVWSRDERLVMQILSDAARQPIGAQFELLKVDQPDETDWVDAGASLYDLDQILTPDLRARMPVGQWHLFTGGETSANAAPVLLAALSVPLVDDIDGRVLGQLTGGYVFNDSKYLLDDLAKALDTDSLALVLDERVISASGNMREVVRQDGTPLRQFGQPDHVLADDRLLIRSLLEEAPASRPLYLVSDRPGETIDNIEATYQTLFTPFLLYVLAGSVLGAYILHRFTSPALERLVRYAERIRQDTSDITYRPGKIREFNALGVALQEAFHDLKESDAQFRALIDESLQGVCIHSNQRILYINDALLRLLGRESEDRHKVIGLQVLDLFAPEEHERLKSYARARASGASAPDVYEARALSQTGERVWVELHLRQTRWNGASAYHVTVTDISERKRQEELIVRQANFDGLTGLPNRTLFRDRLVQAMSRAQWDGNIVALLFLDLDRFKNINDSLGHSVGDQLIKETAARIGAVLDDHDTVARLGGDEFAVILSNVRSVMDVEMAAARLLAHLGRPLIVGNGVEVFATASIGITVFPSDGRDDELLLRQADTAMYHAKADGGNKLRFFSAHMNEQVARALETESALRKALERRQFTLNYQPVVDVAHNRIAGCEALLRWTDPERGVISPAEFIPIAETTGLIVPLGAFVLEEACLFFQRCAEQGLDLPGISVNVSPRQCRDENFIQLVRETVERTGMPPERLHLEITESVMFDETGSDPVETLNAIRRLGIGLSLDDFGTGFSSLSNLKRFPIDVLKIDRSFIRDLETDRDDRALVEAILAMASSLGITVVAEGVETEGQCTLLGRLGCTRIQGFYLGRPMPDDRFREYLEAHDGSSRPRKTGTA
ncbi:EAL domain-containing protein [Stappia indica]|uniref:EAL domain-containing protein n=1 Tax=Stappia indica TaxID=538381 RepID=UPI001D194E8C|nr:EAL domain-containing protein [Stappia indica]MCC4246650.1 EAL domain-containing protein [Stappia indica]